jgi:glycosyltransferase involved in cell wall biosynthesis
MDSSVNISVIIPVYNSEKHLKKCLRSIAASTLRDIEIICIDDGSTDKSLEILYQFAASDQRFIVITQENSGQGIARNKGLAIARGEAVHFCDSDDMVHPDMYVKMLEYIKIYEVDVVCTGTNITYEVHPELGSSDEAYYKLKHSGELVPNPQMIMSVDVAVWNKIYNRSFLIKNKIRFPKHQYEDIVFFWQWFSQCNKIFFLDESLYNYVRRENSFMSEIYNGKAYKIQNDLLETMSSIYSNLKSSTLLQSYESQFWEFFLNMLNFHFRNHSSSYKKIFAVKSKRFDWMFRESVKYKYIYKKYNEVFKWAEDSEILPKSNKFTNEKLYVCGFNIGNIKTINIE